MKTLYFLFSIAVIISCSEEPEKSQVKNDTQKKSDTTTWNQLFGKMELKTQDSAVYVKMEKLYDSLSAHEKRELIDLIKYRGDVETEIEGSHELDRPAEDQSRY